LTRAPTYFMDLIDKVFMEYLEKFIAIFIDGILVYSKSKEEQRAKKKEEHLRPVLQKLRDHRLYAKLSKCEFWMEQESSLSHIILEEQIYMDQSKIQDTLR
jgi:hypothetical protein